MKTRTAHQKMSVNSWSVVAARSERGRSELWGNGPPQAAPAAHRRGSSQRPCVGTASKVDRSARSVNEWSPRYFRLAFAAGRFRAEILMPEKKEKEKKKPARRRAQQAAAESRGLGATQLVAAPPPALQKLQETIESDGGTVLGAYRDPLGGNWQLLAGLPLAKVEPTPYQRDLSETHVAKLAKAIDKLDRYLDPVVVVRAEGGK